MKNMIIGRTIVLMAALLAAPAAAQAQFSYATNADGSIYAYSTNADGTITIAGYSGPPWTVNIPTNLNGLPVVSIGENAFWRRYTVTSVTIPSSVTSIGDSAFELCLWLTNATFANGVLSIGSNAFLQCLRLPSVTIPASVFNIAAGAFAACPDLVAITVDAQNAFYSSVNGVMFDKTRTTLVQCPGGITGSYAIPPSVSSVGDCALEGSALTNVTIPAGVTSIGGLAFAGSALTSVTIPGSVTNIGDCAFEGCGGLTNVIIPSNLTSIGNSVFENCTSLTNVTIPASVSSIGDDAFHMCYNLTSVTIPGSVSYLVGNAFEGCLLTKVFFLGNAPGIGPFNGPELGPPLSGTVYYLPGTTGWSNSFDGRPAVLWNPLIQTGDGSFGCRGASKSRRLCASKSGIMAYKIVICLKETNGSVEPDPA